MAHFSVHIMQLEDANRKPTIFLSHPVWGFDEQMHEAAFNKSPIRFQQYPQLRKLQGECWKILEKYFGDDLAMLIQECQDIELRFQADERIESLFRQFRETALQASDQGQGLVCTGD
jgi:hypothetical protein